MEQNTAARCCRGWHNNHNEILVKAHCRAAPPQSVGQYFIKVCVLSTYSAKPTKGRASVKRAYHKGFAEHTKDSASVMGVCHTHVLSNPQRIGLS